MARGAVKIEGLKALDKALAELGKRTGTAVAYRALEKVGAPVRDTMRDLAPGRPDGKLRGSIAMIRASQERSRLGRVAFGQALRGGGSTAEARGALRSTVSALKASAALAEVIIGPGRHPEGFWAEFGTGERFHEGTGKSVGSMPAEPYIRPAFDAHSGGMVAGVADVLRAEIEKAAKRQAARAARLKAKAGG